MTLEVAKIQKWQYVNTTYNPLLLPCVPQEHFAGQPTFEDFRRLFESAPSSFLVLTPDLTIIAVTDAYLAATMTKREEILGRKLFEVFPDDRGDPEATGVRNLGSSLETVLRTKAEHRMALQKYDIRRPPEQGCTFEVRYWSPLNCPILDDEGNVQFIIHRVEDVTELVSLGVERAQEHSRAHDLETEVLKKTGELRLLTELLHTERTARQSEKQFRELADAIPQLAWIARANGWIYWYNKRWYQYTGTTPESMEGWGWKSVHDPNTLPAVEERWRSSLRTGKPFDMVFPLRGADGRFRSFLTRVTPVRDEAGVVVQWYGTNTDISDEVDAEAKRRRELEQRYRLLVQTMQDYAIFTLDVNGNVTSWNPGAEKLKGYGEPEIIGQHFSRFYTGEDRQVGVPERVLRTALETGHYEGEGWRVRKDGSRFWASVVVTPLKHDDGRLVGFSKITRDMTERKQLLDQLDQRAKELELRVAERDQTNADLEAFSYSVAHDLRAPLRAIEGFATAALEDFENELPKPALEYLQRVVSASERMDNLISDLLQYSRLARAEINNSKVIVKDAIDEARKRLDSAAEARISLNIQPGLTALAHRPTLVQAVLNLITNALKFYPPNSIPHADIRAFREGANIVIQVRDEGIGIDQVYQEQIFKAFERLHSFEEYPGTGIGLAIVERGISKMGGKVRVHSSPGKGSTFTIEVRAA